MVIQGHSCKHLNMLYPACVQDSKSGYMAICAALPVPLSERPAHNVVAAAAVRVDLHVWLEHKHVLHKSPSWSFGAEIRLLDRNSQLVSA